MTRRQEASLTVVAVALFGISCSTVIALYAISCGFDGIVATGSIAGVVGLVCLAAGHKLRDIMGK